MAVSELETYRCFFAILLTITVSRGWLIYYTDRLFLKMHHSYSIAMDNRPIVLVQKEDK